VALITYKRSGVALKNQWPSFFCELIDEKRDVGSRHTNGRFALIHPFSFHSHKEIKSLKYFPLEMVIAY
jgi:hypothetical protein